MAFIISNSENIKKGIGVINQIDSVKFPLLLIRILKALQNKERKCFNETEEAKLQTSLNLNSQDIKILLDTLYCIYEQATYHLAKPSVLSQQLLELGTDENKVEDIINAWTSNAKNVVEKLSQRSIVPQLEAINWRLHLRLANSRIAKEANPTSFVEFQVKNESQPNSSFAVEFSHEQLSEFYQQLENIQHQLDSLR